MTTKKKTEPDEAPEVEEDSVADEATDDADEEETVAKDRGRSKADAAKRLGMRLREIIELRELREGTLVITHDGYPTLWRDDDSLEFGYGRT